MSLSKLGGLPCRLCTKPNAAFELAIRGGSSSRAAAKLHGIPPTTANRHATHIRKAMAREVAAEVHAAPPAPPAGTSPKELAAWHVESIKARLMAAIAANATPKEITMYQGQLTNAMRHHARLSGALDITEAQILRSAPWARVMGLLRETLKAYPDAVLALDKAFTALEEKGAL